MKGLDTYQEVAITTQNRGRLIVLLHDGAIKFLKLAINGINADDMETKGIYINKAFAVSLFLNSHLELLLACIDW